MPLISVRITQGLKTLLPFTIVNVSDDNTLYDTYDGVVNGSLLAGSGQSIAKPKADSDIDTATVTATVGKNELCGTPAVLSALVGEVAGCFGRYFTFIRTSGSTNQAPHASASGNDTVSSAPSDQTGKKNAFDILLQRKSTMVLPAPYRLPRPNAKHSLYNGFIQMLKDMDLGYRATAVEKGTALVETVTNAIWYVDPHLGTIEDRGHIFPTLFQKFRGQNRPGIQNFIFISACTIIASFVVMLCQQIYKYVLHVRYLTYTVNSFICLWINFCFFETK